MATSTLQPDTPIASLTVGQFVDLLNQHGLTAPVVVQKETRPKRYIYGLAGLCTLLGCSHVTAQRLKNSGKIPYSQTGRKLVFEEQAVLTALTKVKK